MSEQKVETGQTGAQTDKSHARIKRVRIALDVAAVLLLAAAVFLAWMRFTNKQQSAVSSQRTAISGQQSAIGKQQSTISLPEFAAVAITDDGIARRPDFKTIIPNRPRVDVITYTICLPSPRIMV
jgi:hypothetical protein